jgi:hypothetical protein
MEGWGCVLEKETVTKICRDDDLQEERKEIMTKEEVIRVRKERKKGGSK